MPVSRRAGDYGTEVESKMDQFPRRAYRISTRREFLGACAAAPVAAYFAGVLEPGSRLLAAEPSSTLLRRASVISALERAAEVERLLQFVDPDVVYRYQPIDPESNAWPLWKEAAERLVPMPLDEDFQAVLESFEKPATAASRSGLKRLDDWVRQNLRCLSLIDEGIARGALERPRSAKDVKLSLGVESIQISRALAQFVEAAGVLRFYEKNHQATADHAIRILKMARILAKSECLVVDFLVANAIRQMGIRVATRVGVHRDTPIEIAQSLLHELNESRPTLSEWSAALRVEFCRWYLPVLADLPDDGPITDLASVYSTSVWDDDFEPDNETVAAIEVCLRQFLAVLSDHESLLNKVDTAKCGSEVIKQLIAESHRPFRGRDIAKLHELRSEMSLWPDALDTDFLSFPLLGRTSNSREVMSEKEVADARESLRPIENIFGKYTISDNLSLFDGPIIELAVTRADAARLLIALALHERKQSHLPERLDELVTAGLLSSVPVDPYDGEPFRYSAQRRVIWCVGEDGENNGELLEDEGDDVASVAAVQYTWRVDTPRRP